MTVSGGSGGLTKLSCIVTSGSAASITFGTGTFTSTYNNYELRLYDVAPSSSGATLKLNFSVAGVNDTSNNYYSAFVWSKLSVTSGSSAGPNPGGTMEVAQSVTTDAAAPLIATLQIADPLSTTYMKMVAGTLAFRVTGDNHGGSFQGMLAIAATAYDGFQLNWSSGNFVNGSTACLYGVQK